MPPDESLSAVIRARDRISRTLSDVSGGLRDAAESARSAAASASAAAEGFDTAEDSGSALERAMESLARDTRDVGSGLGTASRVAESAGESMADAARDSRALARGLDGVGDEALSAAASLTAMRSAAVGVGAGDGIGIGAAADTGDARRSLQALRNTAQRVDETDTTLSVDADGVVSTLASLDAIQRAVDTLDGAVAEVRVGTRGVDGAREALRSLRPAGVDTVDAEADAETEEARRGLDRVTDAARRLASQETTTAIESEGAPETISDLEAARGAAVALDTTDVEVDVETRGIGRARTALLSVRDTVSDIDMPDLFGRGDGDTDTPEVSQGVAQSFRSLPDTIRSLPDLSFDADIDTPEALADALRGARAEALDSVDALADMGEAGDDLIESVDTLPGLIGSLSEQDVDASQFDELSGTAAGLVDDALAGAGSLDELESQIDETGESSLATTAYMGTLDGELGDATRSAILQASSFDELADEIEDVGDQSLTTAAKMGTLDAAMSGVGGDGLGLRMGGLSGSLGTMAKIIPALVAVLGPLAAALGGVATAAGAAGAGLAGIFTGGLLAQGERLAETSSKIQENLREETEDGVMPSDMQESIAGAEEILSQFKEQAFEAMAPLRSAEFGAFTSGVLDGALELISDFSTVAAELSDPLLEMADAVGAAFWDTHPDFLASLMSLTRSLLPVVEDLLIFLIEAMPAALNYMEAASLQLLGPLGELGGNILDLMGPILRIGGAFMAALIPALNVVLPILTDMADVAADILVPALTAVGAALSWLGDAMDGALGAFGDAVGTFVAVTGGLFFVSSIVGTLSSVIMGALIPSLIAMGRAMWASLGPWGIAIGLAVALIDYLGLWEPLIKAAKTAWNGLMNAISEYGGAILQQLEADINTIINVINTLIRIANALPNVDIGEVGQIELPDEVDASGMKVDATDGSFPMPGGGGMGGGVSETDQYAQDRSMVAGSNHETTIDLTGATVADEARLREMVNEAVRDANRSERRRTSGIN